MVQENEEQYVADDSAETGVKPGKKSKGKASGGTWEGITTIRSPRSTADDPHERSKEYGAVSRLHNLTRDNGDEQLGNMQLGGFLLGYRNLRSSKASMDKCQIR